jgi:RNA polymerase sigma-70 factor (ECF subfamily)
VSDASLTLTPSVADRLEQHRVELTAFCYRMLGSSDAEDAVQETFVRAWRAFDRFEGRSALRSWLYRIATNVCFDMLEGRKRRARPMDLGPAREPVAENLAIPGEIAWLEPMPSGALVPDGDPAEIAVARETIKLAFVAALQHLPPRQRAVLILCEVLRWKASEVAELLETSVASVTSALQRARATLQSLDVSAENPPADEADPELLARYVEAFERYDMEALTALIHEDATQSMPPFDLWLSGRDDILTWWVGPGGGCRGSHVVPVASANGSPAFGQYKPNEAGDGYEPWSLQVLEIEDGRIAELTFFLDVQTVFPLFGLPLEWEDRGLTPRDIARRKDLPEPHERDQLDELVRRIAEAHPATAPPGRELQAGEDLHRGGVAPNAGDTAGNGEGGRLRS